MAVYSMQRYWKAKTALKVKLQTVAEDKQRHQEQERPAASKTEEHSAGVIETQIKNEQDGSEKSDNIQDGAQSNLFKQKNCNSNSERQRSHSLESNSVILEKNDNDTSARLVRFSSLSLKQLPLEQFKKLKATLAKVEKTSTSRGLEDNDLKQAARQGINDLDSLLAHFATVVEDDENIRKMTSHESQTEDNSSNDSSKTLRRIMSTVQEKQSDLEQAQLVWDHEPRDILLIKKRVSLALLINIPFFY